MYLKISKFLERLSFKLRQKAIYFELKHYIFSDEDYLKPVYSYTRGIGKTHTLIQLAHKLDIPIAVPFRKQEIYIKVISKDMYGYPVEVFTANECSKGKRYYTILCEEGISKEKLHQIIRPMCKQIIGYDYKY